MQFQSYVKTEYTFPLQYSSYGTSDPLIRQAGSGYSYIEFMFKGTGSAIPFVIAAESTEQGCVAFKQLCSFRAM